MDHQTPCRQSSRAEFYRYNLTYDGAEGFKKNELKPHLIKYWKIPPEGKPLAGKRHVEVTEHRTGKDWAMQIKQMLDLRYPDATKVRLVMDNLNTHNIASLYQAFEPAEARRLAERLEIHYTPKHGSWLNMAEIELSVLKGQCLDRRIAKMETMQAEVAAWNNDRNNRTNKIDWQFTTSDARIKLKRLYPKL